MAGTGTVAGSITRVGTDAGLIAGVGAMIGSNLWAQCTCPESFLFFWLQCLEELQDP